jgi:hypothetical protein
LINWIFFFSCFFFDFLDSDGDDEGENTAKKPETINFVVMLKKNNKPQVNFTRKYFRNILIFILVL